MGFLLNPESLLEWKDKEWEKKVLVFVAPVFRSVTVLWFIFTGGSDTTIVENKTHMCIGSSAEFRLCLVGLSQEAVKSPCSSTLDFDYFGTCAAANS